MTTALEAVLAEARVQGYLGDIAFDEQIDQARSALPAFGAGGGRALDLGSGGGLPGLVLAEATASWRWTLVDVSQRRCDFLRRAVGRLGLAEQVEVVCQAAERLGHDPARRGTYEVVIARSFGPLPWTAECGAGFLVEGGRLLVSRTSDPVTAVESFPELALQAGPPVGRYRSWQRVGPLAARYPRSQSAARRNPLGTGSLEAFHVKPSDA